MSDEHAAVLRRGVDVWNEWRRSQGRLEPALAREDLSGLDLRSADLFKAALTQADLSATQLQHAELMGATLTAAKLDEAILSYARLEDAKLSQAELEGARLDQANLLRADLSFSNMRRADLRGAQLGRAWLYQADLTGADLRGADLRFADLSEANLTAANLSGANLQGAALRGTRFHGADISGCHVYGIAVWDVELDVHTKQVDLVVTRDDQPAVTVDSLEVAQFVYLMLNNERLRDVIDSITSKVVLILGRFTPERKAVLDGLRTVFRDEGYLPILFDFDLPAERDVTETVTLLARMARFIVADLSDPSSIPKELEAVVPGLAVPVLPLLAGAERPYSMFVDYWKYDWVLPVVRYESAESLVASLHADVIRPAEAKRDDLRARRLAAR